MYTASEKQSSNMFGVVMVAALVGAVAGLLFAPKRGSEMREELKGRYNDMKSKSQTAVEDAQTKVVDTVEMASDKVKDVADKTKSAADKTADKARSTKTADNQSIIADDIDTALGRRPRL